MDAILSRADKQVQNVVSALERTLKVVQASRDVHKSLVLNASEQVQASFRQLGESCNQIGPLLRLLHRHMSATSSSSAEQPAMSTASAVPVSGAASAVSATQTESKPAATQSTDSASTTTSEYEFSSDEDDDDLEVVEVAPPKRNKKRKAATVDLSESSPVRRKTHTNSVHKELSGFVRGMFAPSDKFYNWQPRDDPMVAQLLDEMDKRMDGFKDSITQNSRRKAMDEWLQEMTASSFVPCLDLESIPPKTDLRAASVEKCHDSQDLEALVKPGTRICSKLQVDTASKKGKKRKYFQPLLDASTKYYAAVAATETRYHPQGMCTTRRIAISCSLGYAEEPKIPGKGGQASIRPSRSVSALSAAKVQLPGKRART
ncbi:hypothetical protein PC128_g4432 [Phytophthora cactorum]|nr:hypothetical protein PC128_g4432 [Phytophthora cactorum]